MNVVIRNTFLQISSEDLIEDEYDTPKCRSSSAPPTCRQERLGSGDCDVASTSTRCKTIATASSSCEIEDHSSQPQQPARADVSSPRSSCEVESDGEVHGPAEDLTVSAAEAAQQIERMSQRVMDIWSRLQSVQSVEAPMTSSPPAASSPSGGPSMASNTWTWMPVQIAPHWTPVYYGGTASPPTAAVPTTGYGRTPLKLQKLDSKAPMFTPSCKAFGDAQDVVASIKELLMLAPGVANVEVQAPTSEGTLTTVSIKLVPEVSTLKSVVAASKLVFLEAAANSQTVYVMGYEAEPFKDLNESTFATMLATLPLGWQRSACWDTYQKGSCPRGKSCKWQHPGRGELQPVRVTFA